jgi:hypothetical protein
MLQQTVGESASGRSDVEAYFAGGIDVKISQSSFKFEPASAGIALLAAIYFDRRIFGDGCTRRAYSNSIYEDFAGENHRLSLLDIWGEAARH